MKKLMMMVGIPGSGKTTFAHNHASKDDVIVSRDQIRFSLIAETDGYFAKEADVRNLFLKIINDNLTKGKNVWIDATNLTKRSRDYTLKNTYAKTNEIVAILFDVSLDIALQRNATRQGRSKVPEATIENMYMSLENPEFIEGFDKIYIIKDDKINLYTNADGGKK